MIGKLFKSSHFFRILTFFTIFFFLSFITIILLSKKVDIKLLPDFLSIVTSNPLISAVFAALIVLLPINAIQGAADRVKTLESRIDETTGKLDKSIDDKIESATKAALSKALQVEDKIISLERDHEWLKLLSKTKPFVDAKTASAVFESVYNLIRDGHLNFAYIWLNGATEDSINGDTPSFEALALLAIVFFDDTYLANRILSRVRVTGKVSLDDSLILFSLIAYEAGSFSSGASIFNELSRELIPEPIYYPSQIRTAFAMTKSQRIRRRHLRASPAAHIASALYLISISDLDRFQRLSAATIARNVDFSKYPFARKIFDAGIGDIGSRPDLDLHEIWRSFSTSPFDRRDDFMDLIDDAKFDDATSLLDDLTRRMPRTRDDRVYQLWFRAVGAQELEERRRPAKGRSK